MVRLAFCLASSHAIAQQAKVLDPEQHPISPEFQKVYPEKILPLDTKLSWTKRFNGDETFNEDEVLEQVATTTSMAGMGGMEQDGTDSDHGMKMDGMGVIKQLKPDQGKVKIKHGPIERLGMPAMTMVFIVEDAEQLAGLEKGQEVGFSVDNSSGGFVVTHIMAMSDDSMTSSSETEAGLTGEMDAQGEIKTIRVEQGKIKIEHGPIERLGMPAMTMMFKVENPELLNGLQKGNSVNFSVDNSSGGFVITDIKVAE
jgi:Cu/Ag efflux protein CusF